MLAAVSLPETVAVSAPMRDEVTTIDMGLRWPRDVYSLAHIALPFPPDDPPSGDGSGTSVSGLNIGRAILRGEKGHLAMPDSAMTRQHWNPFYRYMEDRILEFLNGVVSRTQ